MASRGRTRCQHDHLLFLHRICPRTQPLAATDFAANYSMEVWELKVFSGPFTDLETASSGTILAELGARLPAGARAHTATEIRHGPAGLPLGSPPWHEDACTLAACALPAVSTSDLTETDYATSAFGCLACEWKVLSHSARLASTCFRAVSIEPYSRLPLMRLQGWHAVTRFSR